MDDTDYGQRAQMEDPSMVGTLAAQAEMIWPLERPLLEALGFGRARSLVDLGCGTGEFAGRAARTWPALEVTGIDLFAGHVALARERQGSERVRFVHGDARATGLGAGTFDVATIRHLLQAVPDVGAMLAEAHRLLRPGGLLYVLAEDYDGLIFDVDDEARRLFHEAAPALRAHGTNLLQGRAARRDLRAAGFEAVRVTPIVVDTERASRETLARMLRCWRDGYAAFIASACGTSEAAIRARFDALVTATLDPERYACWLLFAVAGRKPAV